MGGVFITGTDTGVGKTIVTGLLARYLLDKGNKVITQKWIQTGCKDFAHSDVTIHQHLMGQKSKAGNVLPYMFKFPASPHLAAEIEKRRITPSKIKRYYKRLEEKFDFVLVEGVGGALVCFDRKNLVIDIAKELNLPVLVVAQNKLGAINHTLLSIEALKKRNFKILGIVFNNLKNENARILKDNLKVVKKLSKVRVFGALLWDKKLNKLYDGFLPIGKKIQEQL